MTARKTTCQSCKQLDADLRLLAVALVEYADSSPKVYPPFHVMQKAREIAEATR